MSNKKGILKILITLFLISLITVLIIFSDVCKSGVERGLLICGNVIIPSIFPFSVCVLFILNMNISINSKRLSKVLNKFLGQNFDMFVVSIFSLIGGYPIGCKLVNELYTQQKIDKKTANIMQMYCVNAGPAFIITAVGSGILNSKTVGLILFFSHLTSTLIITTVCGKFTRKNLKTVNFKTNNIKTLAEIFVSSTSNAASSVINICIYVILFSVLNSYIAYFLGDIPILKNMLFFTEVTSALTYTKNAVFIAFLLGFAGISVWCQIFSVSKEAKPDFKLFVLGRFLHGGLSSAITYFLLKVFKIKQNVFSNLLNNSVKICYDDISVSFSLAIMIIVLLIYIYSKNSSRKLLDDVI